MSGQNGAVLGAHLRRIGFDPHVSEERQTENFLLLFLNFFSGSKYLQEAEILKG